MILSSDPNYVNNVKNTIISSSSKKTSNNTSWLVSTSSRNTSITPRKISSKVKGYNDPSQNATVNDNYNKSYLPNPKIQRNNIRVGNNIKLSKKHTIPKDNVIRASSGAKRSKFTNDIEDKMNFTGSKIVMDKESYQ